MGGVALPRNEISFRRNWWLLLHESEGFCKGDEDGMNGEPHNMLPKRFRYGDGSGKFWLYGCVMCPGGDWYAHTGGGCNKFNGNLSDIPFVIEMVEFQWIDTDHTWEGDRMPEETCEWQKEGSLFAPSCAETFHVEMCAFCPSCGKRTELTK